MLPFSAIIRTNSSSETSIEQFKKDEMKKALLAIAREVQRYHEESKASSLINNEEKLNKNRIFKSNLKEKKNQIKNLRQNLDVACLITKILLITKENEAIKFNKQQLLARQLCNDMFLKNSVNEKIKLENKMLKQNMEHIESFINLGYQEIKKKCNFFEDELCLIKKLKVIFICCGHYYANYYNEHEKNVQLKQKNWLLKNKINIMQNNIDVITKELDFIRSQNLKLQKEISIINKHSFYKIDQHADNININSACLFNHQGDIRDKEKSSRKRPLLAIIGSLDFTTHLTLVKSLLCDQDNMLKDLNGLSEEIMNCNKYQRM